MRAGEGGREAKHARGTCPTCPGGSAVHGRSIGFSLPPHPSPLPASGARGIHLRFIGFGRVRTRNPAGPLGWLAMGWQGHVSHVPGWKRGSWAEHRLLLAPLTPALSPQAGRGGFICDSSAFGRVRTRSCWSIGLAGHGMAGARVPCARVEARFMGGASASLPPHPSPLPASGARGSFAIHRLRSREDTQPCRSRGVSRGAGWRVAWCRATARAAAPLRERSFAL